MVLCPALLGAPDFLQEGKKQSRLLIPGDGLEQRGSAEAAKALRQQNDGKYAPTREWKPLGRCPCTAWLCLPAGKLVLWFICPMQINLLPAAARAGELGWSVSHHERGREIEEKGKEATC